MTRPLPFLKIVTVLLLTCRCILAESLQVTVSPKFGPDTLAFDKLKLTNSVGQTLSVTRVDFLLADFALHQKGGAWIQRTNWQAFLSLGTKRQGFDVHSLPKGDYDRLRFNVGLSPEINHAKNTQYGPQHPLNPTLNDLYWGWAGGYIFFALEGHWMKANENIGYALHLGNDWMLTPIELPITLNVNGDVAAQLDLHLEKLFDFEITDATSSTHSRTNDNLAIRLQKNLQHAFAWNGETGKPTASKDYNSAAKKIEMAPDAHPYHYTFSSQFPMPDLPNDNPLTEEGVELGRLLFGEPALSVNREQSCRSCHHQDIAFSDDRRFSRGAEGTFGVRNSMPIFNLAWKKSFFWDGRAKSIREQVVEPIQNPIEMHETLPSVVEKLSKMTGGGHRLPPPPPPPGARPPGPPPGFPDYPYLFRRAFGTSEITTDRIAKALEQFILSELSYNSKFDRAFDGKESLTEEEKRGFELFVTEYDPRREQFGADCFHCHGGPLFQSQSFANNGLDAEFADLGRFKVTSNEADKGKFAVPSLRNVEVTGPYMHDGRFKTLEEVIEHYASGVKRSATLDPNIAKHPDTGIPLTTADKKALVAFLKTLTDEKFKTR